MLLEIDDIHTSYGESYVLQGSSLSVGEGTCVAVLGRNGVGKTTLTRSVMGFTPPWRGEIRFQSTPLVGLSPDRIARCGVALVPQGRRIFKSLTVEENLRVSAGRTRGAQIDRRLGDVWERFPSLAKRRGHTGGNLSGGEQQMLAIGRALMMQPRLLVLDEPTEGLAPAIILLLQQQLEELKRGGMSILLTEQSLGFALALADRAYVMSSRGQVVYEGSADDLTADNAVQSRHLGVTL
jgi:branched-chain amino acid transport system ATP-binding protein